MFLHPSPVRGTPPAPAVGHFLQVSRSDWPGLLHCASIPHLPRTHNDLEQFCGAYRSHERRTTGRKVASPAVVLCGAVRLVACAATRIRPFTSEELAPERVSPWQELRHALESHRQQRTQRRRFRRDPAAYLATLEADVLQLSLHPSFFTHYPALASSGGSFRSPPLDNCPAL